MIRLPDVRIALVTDWFASGGSGPRVTEQILQIFPSCDLFAIADVMPDDERYLLRNKRVTTSFIQGLPSTETGNLLRYLPLMPYAIETLDFSEYDLIISNSHAFAKGVMTDANQIHICYCNSPLRFAWDIHSSFFAFSNNRTKLQRLVSRFKKIINTSFMHRMRQWDVSTSNRVDTFIANSQFTSDRIQKYYQRPSEVVYPPVDSRIFKPDPIAARDFYVVAATMLPYKRFDVIVEAFQRMPNRHLVVIGDGPEYGKIKRLIGRCPNISLLGYIAQDDLVHHLQRAKAFITLAKEDFGITHMEAQACGTPVVALGTGGAAETIVPVGQEKPTGLFVKEPTALALGRALDEFEALATPINPEDCRENAQRFSGELFRQHFAACVEKAWNERTIARKPTRLEEEKAA